MSGCLELVGIADTTLSPAFQPPPPPPLSRAYAAAQAAARKEPLAIGVDHRRRLSSPRVQYRRELYPCCNHVLRGPHPRAVPQEPLDQLQSEPRPARHRLEDARDLTRIEPLAEGAAPGDRAKEPPLGERASLDPPSYQRHGVSGEVHHVAPALALGLRATHQMCGASPHLLHQIRNLQGDELGAAQQRIVGDCEQRAVAVVDEPPARDIGQATAKRPGERLRLALSAALSPVHVPERKAHLGRRERRLAPERAVRDGESRRVAAHRRGRAGGGHCVDERGDGLRARRQRLPPRLFAPAGVDGEVRPDRAFGVEAEARAGCAGETPELVRDARIGLGRWFRGCLERGCAAATRAPAPSSRAQPVCLRGRGRPALHRPGEAPL